MTRVSIGRAVLLCAGLIGMSATALAQDTEETASPEGQSEDDQRAALHFRAGTSYFADENFEEALQEFQSAHRLSGRPEMLYNIGLTLERLGRWSEAVRAHEQFIAEVPEDHPDAEEARERLERARQRAEHQNAQVEEEELEEVEVEAEVEVAPEDDGPGLAPWLVVGASVAVGAVALGTGLAAHGIHGDLEADCPDRVCDPSREGDIGRGQALARASTALTFIAAAGAVTGVVLFFVGGGEDSDARARLEVAPTRGGGYVQGRLTF